MSDIEREIAAAEAWLAAEAVLISAAHSAHQVSHTVVVEALKRFTATPRPDILWHRGAPERPEKWEEFVIAYKLREPFNYNVYVTRAAYVDKSWNTQGRLVQEDMIDILAHVALGRKE